MLALCAGTALVCALASLFRRNLYGNAVCLLVVLLQTGAVYFLLGARLLGLMQVLVYAGGIMVLIIIALMASPPEPERRFAEGLPKAAALLAAAALSVGLLVLVPLSCGSAGLPPRDGDIDRRMAAVLFGPYALLTEAVGLLVLLASMSVLKESDD